MDLASSIGLGRPSQNVPRSPDRLSVAWRIKGQLADDDWLQFHLSELASRNLKASLLLLGISVAPDDRLRRILRKSWIRLRQAAKQEARAGAGSDCPHVLAGVAEGRCHLQPATSFIAAADSRPNLLCIRRTIG